MKLFQSGYRKLWSAVGIFAMAIIAFPVLAQDVAGEAEAGDLVMEEIIVTASRREENLQEYVGTIQAFTGMNSPA